MRKIICSLLIGIIWVGCGEDEMIEDQPEITRTEVVDNTPPSRDYLGEGWRSDGVGPCRFL